MVYGEGSGWMDGAIYIHPGIPGLLEPSTQLSVGKRVRGEPAASSMAVDLAVVRTHAQWWSSDLKPQLTALSHQMVEGSG